MFSYKQTIFPEKLSESIARLLEILTEFARLAD